MSTLDNIATPDTAAIEDKTIDTYDALVEPEVTDETPEIITLSEEKEDKLKENETESESEIDELEKELNEEDKKDKDPTAEELEELIQPVRRAEILAKYPKLFKDFPYLERAYYRNREFTEMFSVPKEAREAKNKADTLDNFERVLMSGETHEVLRAVKQTDEKSFAKIVDNYLYDLAKVDPVAANHVTGNVVKHTIAAMLRTAQKEGDDTLEAAAKILNKFIFLTSDIQQPVALTKKEQPNPELDRIAQERQQFAQERYQTTVTEIGGKIENRIKATIDANIDTKEIMSDYVRSNASRDVYEKLTQALLSDKQFQTVKDRLWKRAAENNYSKESLQSIESAFISKAKTLLPTVIKEAKTRALKGMGKRVKETLSDEPSERVQRKGVTQPRTASKEPTAKMSTLDYLNQD